MSRIPFTKDVIDYLFQNANDTKLIGELQSLFDQTQDPFNVDATETLATGLIIRLERNRELFGNWIETFYKSSHSSAKLLKALIASENGDFEEAIRSLTLLFETMPSPDPFLLLQRARLFVRTKKMIEAGEDLKYALSLHPPYSFYVKSEKLISKIVMSGKWIPRRTVKIALMSSSTTSFLAPVLKAACFRDGISADIYEGNYGNYQQEILNPGSGLFAFTPHVVLIVLNHRDLALPPTGKPGFAEIFCAELRDLWSILQKRNPCHIIQVGFDIPPDGAWGSLEDSLPNGRAKLVNSLNIMLSKELPSGVSFIDVNRIGMRAGTKFRSDVEWFTAKIYPSTDALPVFSNYVTSHLRATLGLSAKVLVADLDNTLWGGVVGEDGVGGIVLGPPSPEGEGFVDLQRYIKELKDRGILIAVCSKNNLEDAQEPFAKHNSMLLKLEDFVMFTANWKDKASNIKGMADTLSLGLDSFVFIDDNPLERAWVRVNLPEVVVPECGSKPWDILASLRRGMFFESTTFTKEDAARYESYKSNIARKELEKSMTTVDDFLMGLEMVAETGPIDANTLSRVTQLINKTNQFNLTSKRYSEEQVRAMAESSDWWTRWFRLKDKFGDHGLIGVILASKEENKIWYIDTWLMSCRVLGRKMEDFMCEELLRAAQKEDVSHVFGEYIPTAKNVLVKELYSRLGFIENGSPNRYSFNILNSRIPECNFISELKPL